jgi:hypothetical protein
MPIGQFVVWVRSLVILPIECFLICFLLAVLLSFFPSPLWSRHRIPYFHTLLLIVYSFICTFMPPHHAPLPMSTISSVETATNFTKVRQNVAPLVKEGIKNFQKIEGVGNNVLHTLLEKRLTVTDLFLLLVAHHALRVSEIGVPRVYL